MNNNTIRLRKSGRVIQKTAASQRRLAIRNALPTLTQLETLTHTFVEFLPSGATATRRFYVAAGTPNRYYCYVPVRAERSFDSLPTEGSRVVLHSTSKLRTVARAGNQVIEVGDTLTYTASDVAYTPDFNIACITLQ